MAVQSSVLASLRYSIEATLELEFRTGAIYRYVAVPDTVVHGLLAADSKGAYFNRHIRNHFRSQRVA
jgi:lysyl-tRNA synthetase class 2